MSCCLCFEFTVSWIQLKGWIYCYMMVNTPNSLPRTLLTPHEHRDQVPMYWRESDRNSCPSPAVSCVTAQVLTFSTFPCTWHSSPQQPARLFSLLLSDCVTRQAIACTNQKMHFQNICEWRHTLRGKNNHIATTSCITWSCRVPAQPDLPAVIQHPAPHRLQK